jgi:hypothetical protein
MEVNLPDAPQAWSKALKGHPIGADGIVYTARHDNEALRYALFDEDPEPTVWASHPAKAN